METTTVASSRSPTTTHYDDIFHLSTTNTRAKATSESVTVLYPADTEEEIVVDTDPSLSTIARKSTQAVALREAVAWALLALMTLIFIGTLSVVILLRMQKHRQNRDIPAEAPGYEMDGNPCYESSKMDTTYGTNVYEPIEIERGVQHL